jgi:hypothetical protein
LLLNLNLCFLLNLLEYSSSSNNEESFLLNLNLCLLLHYASGLLLVEMEMKMKLAVAVAVATIHVQMDIPRGSSSSSSHHNMEWESVYLMIIWVSFLSSIIWQSPSRSLQCAFWCCCLASMILVSVIAACKHCHLVKKMYSWLFCLVKYSVICSAVPICTFCSR